MADKSFIWTRKLAKKMFELRFQNDWLFKSKKQPWMEFYSILLENGFPKEMNINHLRKKWSYTYDAYRIAKKEKNKKWPYYKMFDKHFGKNRNLDKYESWNDEWRLKLIVCIMETKQLKLDYNEMWKTVETAMRSQDLPLECCIQDMKGLWHHLRTTFRRKQRLKQKHGWKSVDWPLYDIILEYCQKYDPTVLLPNVELSKINNNRIPRVASVDEQDESSDFHWTKDLTESFIQIRLQNDILFRTKKQAWSHLLDIMTDQCDFPKTMTSGDLRTKWSSTYSEFQRAKATNNKCWLYYNLFDLYMGDGSLNPSLGWPDEWILSLIQVRMELEYLFITKYPKDECKCWREVEMKLRSQGIPMECSLFDLPAVWAYLVNEFKWKRKFAKKGLLNEPWQFYDAMARYEDLAPKVRIQQKTEACDEVDDDFEDDLRLVDLKQKLLVKEETLKEEEVDLRIMCRCCNRDEGCVSMFGQIDADGNNVAEKLKIICGLQVDETESLPTRICVNCFRELECAYKFRNKCIKADQELRELKTTRPIKLEVKTDDQVNNDIEDVFADGIFDDHLADDLPSDLDVKSVFRKPLKKERKPRVFKKKRKKIDDSKYTKMCEICGKHSRHLRAHLDAHATEKAYSCEVCDKKFKFKSGLIIHKAVHDPTPKKTCEVCGKTFHILAQYRRHYAYHANERNFECGTCFKKFNSRDILRVHIRMHTDERPFSCPECGKTFRTAGCVSRHKRIVHKKIVKGQ